MFARWRGMRHNCGEPDAAPAMSQSLDIVADIGGTNARFGCAEPGSGVLQQARSYLCADFDGLEAALRAYASGLQHRAIGTLCLALAAPIDQQDRIQLTNHPWSFSRSRLAELFQCRVVAINDFFAQASCLDTLRADEFDWWGTPRPRGGHVRVILGAGTGLGVAALSPSGEVLPTEGGHVAFAPATSHELLVLELLWRQFGRVSIERLLSGPGLVTLYRANAQLSETPATAPTPPDITRGALNGDSLCLQAIRDFLDILARTAGDFALSHGALDGIYLTGGILPKLDVLLNHTRFRERFEAKGRFQGYCARVPLALIRAENTGLRGCLAALRRMA
jgi:glucokinase